MPKKSKKSEVNLDSLTSIVKEYAVDTSWRTNPKTGEALAFDSGIISLNMITGIGGLPIGKMVQYYGAKASGKTSAAMTAAKSVIEAGGAVLWIDTEDSFNYKFANSQGLDVQEIPGGKGRHGGKHGSLFFKIHPKSMEDGFNSILKVLRNEHKEGRKGLEGNVHLIVWDSLGGTVVKSERDKDADDKIRVASAATILTAVLPRLRSEMTHLQSRATILFINQYRDSMSQYEKPDAPGGHQLHHQMDLNVLFNKSSQLKYKMTSETSATKVDQGYGHVTRMSLSKSRVSRDSRFTEAVFVNGRGFDNVFTVVRLAAAKKIIKVSGSKHVMMPDITGQAEEVSAGSYLKAVKWYKQNLEAYPLLRDHLLEVVQQEESSRHVDYDNAEPSLEETDFSESEEIIIE